MSLKLLAKVPDLDPATKEYCGWDVTRQNKAGQAIMREARFPYFAKGFVDMNLPRDAAFSIDISAATIGYGVADENGVLLGEFKTIAGAEKAMDGAKMRLVVDVAAEEPAADVAAGK